MHINEAKPEISISEIQQLLILLVYLSVAFNSFQSNQKS